MNTITVSVSSTGRSAYRVVPSRNDPVILQIDGELVRVLDISANGLSCPEAAVKQGRRYPFKLDLPLKSPQINGYLDVMPGSSGGKVQCQFVELAADEVDLLHHYVLVRQKEALRSLRSGG